MKVEINHFFEEHTYKEKNKQLFLQQKELLETFLTHGAISNEQYEKSLHDLIEKMGLNNDI